MIGKIIATLLGETGVGQRKFVIGMVAVTMLFVVSMWWPGQAADKADVTKECIDSIIWVVAAVAGTILGERFGKAKP